MSTAALRTFFRERFEEVQEYLLFLGTVEEAARMGPPKFQGLKVSLTTTQQKILYSSLYLQLYNLVEATVSRCLDEVANAAAAESAWKPAELNESMRQEWVRGIAKTHSELNAENRLTTAVSLCEHLVQDLPISEFAIEKGGGGNWDDESIYKIGKRVGCPLRFKAQTIAAVKPKVKGDVGALKLVKTRRNGLAHGSLSFVECADGISVNDLVELTDVVGNYLQETMNCFAAYIDGFEFLRTESRPA